MITPDVPLGPAFAIPFEPFVRPDRLINPIASFFQAEQARLPLDRAGRSVRLLFEAVIKKPFKEAQRLQ
jgi:hypothetical protein